MSHLDSVGADCGFGYDQAGNRSTVTSLRGYEQGADPTDHTTIF